MNNKMKGYIIEIIRLELIKRYMWAHDLDIDDIADEIIKGGNYAFRVIYSDVAKGDPYIKNHTFKLETFKSIDWRLVKRHPIDNGLFSIDGGVRYQWSYYEILFIDPSTVRDIKIGELGI